MDFGEWVETVPERVRAESCWRFEAYPKTLYLYKLTWDDCNVLMRDARGRAVAKQLIRSAGSISANVKDMAGAWGAKSTFINPVTANTILHSPFSILGGALWPSCNTLS